MGGGIGMGNTCKPMAVSFQCMTKFTTNKKKIVLAPQLYSFICDPMDPIALQAPLSLEFSRKEYWSG